MCFSETIELFPIVLHEDWKWCVLSEKKGDEITCEKRKFSA